jgi:hypothetical protein
LPGCERRALNPNISPCARHPSIPISGHSNETHSGYANVAGAFTLHAGAGAGSYTAYAYSFANMNLTFINAGMSSSEHTNEG